MTEFNPCHNPALDKPPADTPVTTKFEGQSVEGNASGDNGVHGLPAKQMLTNQ